MKIGVLTLAFNEENLIGDCVKQFKQFRHLILISSQSWWGDQQVDDTELIANQQGAEVICGYWESEHEQRNFGMEWLSDCDWILIVDADERYSKESIERMRVFLERADGCAYGINTIYTYWKDWNHRIEPQESGGLIVAVRPNVRFLHLRCIDTKWSFLPKEIVMHHGSYVRTDAEMVKKCKQLKHNGELVDNWYEEKWLSKNPINFHPCNPHSFERIEKCKKPF